MFSSFDFLAFKSLTSLTLQKLDVSPLKVHLKTLFTRKVALLFYFRSFCVFRFPPWACFVPHWPAWEQIIADFPRFLNCSSVIPCIPWRWLLLCDYALQSPCIKCFRTCLTCWTARKNRWHLLLLQETCIVYGVPVFYIFIWLKSQNDLWST